MQHGDGGRRSPPGLRKLITTEAAAYLRCSVLAPSGLKAIREGTDEDATLGVVFVPGVGANSSQFTALKQALGGVAEWFDAFEYWTFKPMRDIARALGEHLEKRSARAERILLVGHSMGGVVSRMVLQGDDAPKAVAGFVTICSPLHGTWRAKLAPSPTLRALAPDSELVRTLITSTHRLAPLKENVLNVGVRYDSFVTPYDSAFLEGYERLLLEDSGHVAALFDTRVHTAVRALAKRVASGA